MQTDYCLTVTALNRYVKSLLDEDINLKSVFVRGEISNFTNHYKTGHYYMTLKDENAQIKAVMFKMSNQRLKFMPENDMSVIVRGRVSLYDRSGDYQLYIDDMQPDGTGKLAFAFEQLKKRLSQEGLFDENKKKALPAYPKKVGVITSSTGAAVRDIINVIGRRYPLTEIVLYPVAVQGDSAPAQIAAAIGYMNENTAADLLIVGRGGGSVEDLWAFNEEVVARAVYDSEIPVISAVGHETDFTICDFVADLRAPTPSAAAELAVPDINELSNNLLALSDILLNRVSYRLSSENTRLISLKSRLEEKNPIKNLESMILRLDSVSMKIDSAVNKYVSDKLSQLKELAAKTEAMDPLRILGRGYSVVYKDGNVVSKTSDLSRGDNIDIRLSDGIVKCEVK
ncbi:MAG: exodeoxyribonuclease VII large subunit [Clostridia bacterium]|nr:exodeoxyribonuclease VII large subunit [Clostridia bacterium]